MNRKYAAKRFLFSLLLVLTLGALTACACSADTAPMVTMQPSNQPAISPSPTTIVEDTMPDGMMDGMTTDGTTQDGTTQDGAASPAAQGVTNVTNARKAMEQIEDELERLSEVNDAQVVLAGNTAAVALTFDKQYMGGIDERLENMVKERIKGVVTGVDNVAVTQDTNLFDQLEKLGDRLDDASDMADIQTELDAIVTRIRQAA